ncbi:MAG: hypothetical protein ACXVJ7_18000 [Acidimicrobiia bacterium]
MDLSDVADRLRGIEEDLRDRAYDALRAAAAGDEDAAAIEKKILQARRAIERAIRALDPEGGWAEGA